MKKNALLRGGLSLALALSTLWATAAAAPARSLGEAARSLGDALPLFLLRFERGDLLSDASLSLPALLVLHTAPLLLSARDEVTAAWAREEAPAPSDPAAPDEPDAQAGREAPETPPAAPAPDAPAEHGAAPSPLPAARDNGVPSSTLRPTDPSGYLVRGSVYVNNASSAPLSADELGFAVPPSGEAPQVLIVHTHGCEAYTMPAGEEYEESDDHRTLDEAYNVLRVGDELANELTAAGLGVLHDRTLHDYPSYSGAYNRSLATVEKYRAQYPSIAYVIDLHRDAVADAEGREYKLLCAEEPNAAQLEFVVGSDGGGLSHEHWRENLRLACAVQETLLSAYPTLMRPIVVRNSRYNQQVCPGALLLEVGAAGNSLEEALNAARLFARGFAETVAGEQPHK